ncbi:MAG: M48 family metallopeptidase [Limisphaerales bacterium]
MAPPEVLDYLVVHELAHLAEPYHSTKFWFIVLSHCPDFDRHRRWLVENEARLMHAQPFQTPGQSADLERTGNAPMPG